MLDHERKQLKQGRVQYQREMQSKTELEHLLRETVEQVRNDRKNQKQGTTQQNGAKFIMASQLTTDNDDLGDLNQSERERVIELLLSQEKVIALLYEKTFPMTSTDNNKINYGEETDANGINDQNNNNGEDYDNQDDGVDGMGMGMDNEDDDDGNGANYMQ